MKLQIDVISREMVTPSSPTPLHLNKYKLSFFDQIMPQLLTTPVLFYPASNENLIMISNSERSNHLKKSLSKALTMFYPLAGRLVANSYVDCNDEGVTFVEAEANCNIFDVITDLNPEELLKFVPCEPEDVSDLCLVVQATFFCCGGLAIGVGISHKVADVMSYIMFVNCWAAFSRDESPVQSPKFELATLFPPEEDLANESETAKREKKVTLVTKMFSFSSEKITDLRERYSKNTKGVKGLIHPSRVETLSAFIGTRIMAATGGANDDNMARKDYALRIAIDVRTRVVPPLSEYHFGNMVVAPEITLPPLENDDEDGAYGIVKRIRGAIRDVNRDDLRNLVEKPSKSEAVMCWFSSLCGFPVNKVDFGWGIPAWFGIGRTVAKNMVFLTNSLSGGGGIDALVSMEVEEMTKFEADKELLEYISSRN